MYKLFLFVFFASTISVFSKPYLIKDFLNNPKTKIVVIDSTIKDTDLAVRRISDILFGFDIKIISLNEYRKNLKLYKKMPAVFWGVFFPNGLIWNSISETNKIYKSNYKETYDISRNIQFGMNPYTKKTALLFFAKSEDNLYFHNICKDWKQSYYTFAGPDILSCGAIDFKSNEGINYCINLVKAISRDDTLKDGNITLYNFVKYEMTISAIPDSIVYIYAPDNVDKINQIGKKGDYRYLVNASYFSGLSYNAKHLGRLAIWGNNIIPVIDTTNKQLTHVVQYNKREQKISFVKRENFKSDPDSANSLEFQTGPCLIENNSIDSNCIKSVPDGMKNITNTLLAATDNKNIFLITVREETNLVDLAKYLLTLKIFKGRRLDVVNLLGGSSTAFYSKKFSNLNFYEHSRSPFLIGVR